MQLSNLVPIALLAASVEGHGYMSFPQSRNVYKSHYCPQCANGASVCGSGASTQWPADDAGASALNSEYTTPLTTLIAGGKVEVEVAITAAHMGHFALELCANPGSEITDSCFTKLERDPTDERYSPYVSSAPWASIFPENSCASTFNGSPMKVRYNIPSGVSSDHAVLRWYWQTGNSCAGMVESVSGTAPSSVTSWSANINGNTCKAAVSGTGSTTCGSNCPNSSCSGEHFKNCADVKITSGDSSTIVTSGNHNTSQSTGGSGSGSNTGGSNSGSNTGGSNSGSNTGGSNSGSNTGGSNSGSNAGGSNSGSNTGGSGSNSGSNTGNNGSNTGSSTVAACQSGVHSDNPTWLQDCKDKCDFYNTNPIYCNSGEALLSCVKRLTGYC